jgi:hypothetical protein
VSSFHAAFPEAGGGNVVVDVLVDDAQGDTEGPGAWD